jgi:UDP-glucose 4-epimerase
LKNCLVTGGGGFIGSHLVDRLLADGHKVTVIDNLASGNLINIAPHQNNARLQFLQLDVADHEAIAPHFTNVNWVFHLAALADIVPSMQYPLKYHCANVDGTISVLEAARKANVKRFIYAASSSCYGIPDQYPTRESAPIRAEYPYAVTKYLGEEYVRYWEKIYRLPAVSLRFFNVYGPRARTAGTYGAVFGVFLAQKIYGQPFTVVGDGTQTRDFTFVTDVVEACVAAAASNLTGEVMNVGSGNTYSVNRLVELLGGPVVYIPKRPGEPDCTFADTSKIRRLLNWQPQVSFEEGVRLMLENIDYWKTAPVWTPEKIAEATKAWFQYLGKPSPGK